MLRDWCASGSGVLARPEAGVRLGSLGPTRLYAPHSYDGPGRSNAAARNAA
jgi:hypothetical protein